MYGSCVHKVFTAPCSRRLWHTLVWASSREAHCSHVTAHSSYLISPVTNKQGNMQSDCVLSILHNQHALAEV